MKKNVNGVEIEMTAEEISEFNETQTSAQAQLTTQENLKTENENIKASAKAKLVAGTPLTEEEANTIVL